MMSLENRIDQYDKFLNGILSGEIKDEARARAEVFAIGQKDLTEQVEEQPGIYSYISTLCAAQEAERNKAKLEEKITKARTRIAIKESPPPGKWTADDYGALAESDPSVVQACAEHIYQQRILDHLEADKEASRQKGEMLRLLALSLKQEQMLKSGY